VTPSLVMGTGPRGSRAVTLVANGPAPRWWVVRWRSQSQWTTQVLPGSRRELSLVSPTDASVDWVVLTAVDGAGATSDDAAWRAELR
jgi:hypothetical protein